MMRLTITWVAAAAIAILFSADVAMAQSGGRGAPSAPVINAPQSFNSGGAIPGSVVNDGFIGGQSISNGAAPTLFSGGSDCNCGASGGGSAVYSPGSYGYAGGCGGCQNLSIRTPSWSANACPCPLPYGGFNIGRSYGRPLIGRWCGY